MLIMIKLLKKAQSLLEHLNILKMISVFLMTFRVKQAALSKKIKLKARFVFQFILLIFWVLVKILIIGVLATPLMENTEPAICHIWWIRAHLFVICGLIDLKNFLVSPKMCRGTQRNGEFCSIFQRIGEWCLPDGSIPLKLLLEWMLF